MSDFWKTLGTPVINGITSLTGGLLSGLFQSGSSRRQIEAAKEINGENIRMQRETNAQNYKMFQEANEFNANQADLAWQRQQDMFNMENAYNSPLEIVKRLEEAGINPQVAFNGMTGMAASADGATPSGGASSAGVPSLTAPRADILPDYAGFNPFDFIAKGIKSFAESAQAVAAAKKTGIETERLEKSLSSFLEEQEASAKLQKLNAYLVEKYGDQKMSGEVAKIFKEIDNLTLSGDLLNAQYRLTQLEGDIKATESRMLDEKYKRVKEYIDNELNMQKAEIMKKEAEALAIPKQVEAQLTSAMAAWRSAGAAELSAQTKKWMAENPTDAISYLIRGLSLNGLDAKQVVEWIGKKFGFLQGNIPSSNKVDKLFNSEKWWRASPVLTVGKGLYDLFD